MKRLTALFCLFALALPLAGCTPQKPGAGDDSSQEEPGFTFVDDLGRSVTVDSPQRVAALMGSFAETWLLAGGELAAVTQDAFSERELNLGDEVKLVGTNKTPSLELLLAAQPDLVILSANSASHLALRDSMESAGLNLAFFAVNSFPEYLHMLDICTQITGRRDLYDANGLAVQQRISAVLESVPAVEQPPRVLLLRTSSGGVRAKNSQDTVTGIMLRELGCVNIADSDAGLLENLSLEVILAEDPDFIFVLVQGADTEAALAQLEESLTASRAWSGLTAVKEERFFVLDKQLFQYKPNARWGESYELLADILYGAED